MKVSVCITVFNEEKSVRVLIESLVNQTKKPDEIVIVDGVSNDRTVEIIRHLQKKHKNIRLLVQKCTRAEGRNLSVEIARNNIIAVTDADCVAQNKWLEKITEPFKHSEVDIVAGFYEMQASSALEKAISFFLAVTPKRFNADFLPSTRSVAFRKELWERVGGFPEDSDNSAEDTDFNYEAVNLHANIARIKDAIVYWKIPIEIGLAYKKFFDYAKWDAKKLILWHPIQKFRSHNVRALFKIFRYAIFLIFLFLSFKNSLFYFAFFGSISLYMLWAFRKVYAEFNEVNTGFWGIYVQFISDFAVIGGFITGVLTRKK